MAPWRERRRECGETGKKRAREKEARVREEGGASSPFYSRPGLPGCCQVTEGVKSKQNTGGFSTDIFLHDCWLQNYGELRPRFRSLVSGGCANTFCALQEHLLGLQGLNLAQAGNNLPFTVPHSSSCLHRLSVGITDVCHHTHWHALD